MTTVPALTALRLGYKDPLTDTFGGMRCWGRFSTSTMGGRSRWRRRMASRSARQGAPGGRARQRHHEEEQQNWEGDIYDDW
jgi:hypothetical protein